MEKNEKVRERIWCLDKAKIGFIILAGKKERKLDLLTNNQLLTITRSDMRSEYRYLHKLKRRSIPKNP